ncbi:MAG: PAS domain-containing sensor histidine kinase [Planctomycetota bacterium]|jgi:signal transduction histidine kinase
MKFGSEKTIRILAVKGRLITLALVDKLVRELSPLAAQVDWARSLDDVVRLPNLGDFHVLLLEPDLSCDECMDVLIRIRESHPHLSNIIIAGRYGPGPALKVIAQKTHQFAVYDPDDWSAFYEFVLNSIRQQQTSRIVDHKQKSLQAIFDAVPVGMMLMDENMIVRRANQTVRKVAGKPYSQIIGSHVGEALGCINAVENAACEDRYHAGPSCADCALVNTVRGVLDLQQPAHDVEFHPTFASGSEQKSYWFSLSAEPTAIEGRRYVVVAFDDVTQRRQAEQRLRETMDMKARFISTVSHELRTPLTCMKEAIAVVRDGATGRINDKQADFLNIAAKNIDRLAELINNVLDFQRLEAERAALNVGSEKICEVVGEACHTMAPLAKKKGLDLSVEVEGDLPEAQFDGDKIIQVLTNLISNAIKFTAQGGRIEVRAQRRGEEWVIAVSDTGEGMPREALPRIFDSFYRVNRPGRRTPGTGLGLAIVKKIVALHNGRIDVESRVGHGSTFKVFLPLKMNIPVGEPLEQQDEIIENSLVARKREPRD